MTENPTAAKTWPSPMASRSLNRPTSWLSRSRTPTSVAGSPFEPCRKTGRTISEHQTALFQLHDAGEKLCGGGGATINQDDNLSIKAVTAFFGDNGFHLFATYALANFDVSVKYAAHQPLQGGNITAPIAPHIQNQGLALARAPHHGFQRARFDIKAGHFPDENVISQLFVLMPPVVAARPGGFMAPSPIW